MAEFVDRRLERGLGELEQMVRVGLFTEEERKAIIQKRKGLEYRVQRYEKSVEDHLEYIKHEMNFLDLIKLRRARLGYALKFSDIEGSIGKRCQARLLQAERRFPGDMDVWKLHIELCKKLNWSPVASQVYTRMLQIHADKLDIWVQASLFELDSNGSPDNARQLCLKAMRWHEKNPDIWKHHFSVEMRIAQKVFQRAAILDLPTEDIAAAEDSISSGKVALLVAINGMDTIKTLDFAASLYGQAVRFGCEPDVPETLWKAIATGIQQHIENSLSSDPDFLLQKARFSLIPVKNARDVTEYELIKAEKQAYDILDKAVAEICNENNWNAYLRFLAELRTDSNPADWLEIERLRFQKADAVYREADARGFLGFDHCLSWAKVCLDRRKFTDGIEILRKAVSLGPKNINDFHRLISLYELIPEQKQTILSLTLEAKKTILPKDLDFWQHIIKWTVEHSLDQESAEATFRDGLKQTRPIVAFVSEEYVKWAYKLSPAKGRSVYASIHLLPGVCTEAFMKWVIAEEERLNCPILTLRKLYEQALSSLGTDSTDLWIGYLTLESSHKQGDLFKLADITWKAKRTLRPDLVSFFVTMSDLLLNGKR